MKSNTNKHLYRSGFKTRIENIIHNNQGRGGIGFYEQKEGCNKNRTAKNKTLNVDW